MRFKDFAQKLYSVIGAGSSTSAFCKTLFESIVDDEAQEILDSYTDSSYKGFYNGNTSITGISKKINAYVNPDSFEEYINQFSDPVVSNLCKVFSSDFTDPTSFNIAEHLSASFIDLITQAAQKKKRPVQPSVQQPENDVKQHPLILSTDRTAADLGLGAGDFIVVESSIEPEEKDPFQIYIDKAIEYYSQKKTLLRPESPSDFRSIYVCNDLMQKINRNAAAHNMGSSSVTLHNATLTDLAAVSRNIIIQGTGGIGKSMFLTHLFLSSAVEYKPGKDLPVFASLKDYKNTAITIEEFIYSAIASFVPEISRDKVKELIQERTIIALLDGLDEIPGSIKTAFFSNVDSYVKRYPGARIVISSRPTPLFVQLSRFHVLEILPLTRDQAVEMVEKIDFWDPEAQKSFIHALKRHLYRSHKEFASNPLLLTIMLMTYSYYGDIPGRMHIFYAKAYETMARLHDATKLLKRPFSTGLTPEDFAKYFSEFCARTYKDEVLEFTEIDFSRYMDKIIKKIPVGERRITSSDFLIDLTDNLCIMYCEGNKYYFIHRSFQEYFTAVFFSSALENKLLKLGDFFNNMKHRAGTDKTFYMLYDMIPEKIERFVFLPFLHSLFDNLYLGNIDEMDESDMDMDSAYWRFLMEYYPTTYIETGDVGSSYYVEDRPFLYQALVHIFNTTNPDWVERTNWPKEMDDLPGVTKWVVAHSNFLTNEALREIEGISDLDRINPELLESYETVDESSLPYKYEEILGEPEQVGQTIEVDIEQIYEDKEQFKAVYDFINDSDFALREEFVKVIEIYIRMRDADRKEESSDDLFDD